MEERRDPVYLVLSLIVVFLLAAIVALLVDARAREIEEFHQVDAKFHGLGF